jgi:hypothetical protein
LTICIKWLITIVALAHGTFARAQYLPVFDPNQQRFEQAVKLMSTDVDQAIDILRALYQATKAVRVQLELARSLFLAGRLADAKVEFISVLEKPIPIAVRDRVEWYLSEIQKRGTAKIYVGFFQDSNPGQITAERTFNVFGQPLTYQPNISTRPELGLNISAEIERELVNQSGLFLQTSAATFTYPTSAFNRQLADVSLIKRWQGDNYKDVRIGNEFSYYGGNFLYNSPYVSTRWVFNKPNQDALGVWAKAAVLNYPNYPYLNGSQVQVQFQYLKNFYQNFSGNIEIGVDRTSAAETAYSSYGASASLGVQVAEDKYQMQANVRATVLRRNYWDIDPLWGAVRSDAGQVFSITFTKRNFYVFGLRPEAGYIYQMNNSSLPFYSYSKGMIGLFFKNVY